MNNLIVLPYKNKWAVLEEHKSQISSVHSTAGAAIDAALRRRQRHKSELIILAKSIRIHPAGPAKAGPERIRPK